jgi:hypothetical protein
MSFAVSAMRRVPSHVFRDPYIRRPPVRKDIHALFDEGKLILLPEQDIVI